MLLYQYAYYAMREADKHSKFPIQFTRIRTFSVLSIIEALILATVNLVIYRVIHGQNFHKLPSPPYPVITFFACGLVVYYINKRIIGNDSRIHRYKEIFDSWDKWKRLRWKILLICIAVASLASFYLVSKITQYGLAPQNWKYNWTFLTG